jgi:succinyl-CoA synthetase alpha subunit
MTVHDDTPEMEDEWQFDEADPEAATFGGGGLLQAILDEVTTLRGGAEADRVSLADALSASFAKLEVEIQVLREQVASLRNEVDASTTAATSAFAQAVKELTAENDVDVAAVVERAVAAQGHASVEAVIAALTPQLTALRNSMPTADTARIAVEINRLRQALIGPDHR